MVWFLGPFRSNYLQGPTISMYHDQVRKFGLRNGDTVEGEIRSPKMEKIFLHSKSEPNKF